MSDVNASAPHSLIFEFGCWQTCQTHHKIHKYTHKFEAVQSCYSVMFASDGCVDHHTMNWETGLSCQF